MDGNRKEGYLPVYQLARYECFQHLWRGIRLFLIGLFLFCVVLYLEPYYNLSLLFWLVVFPLCVSGWIFCSRKFFFCLRNPHKTEFAQGLLNGDSVDPSVFEALCAGIDRDLRLQGVRLKGKDIVVGQKWLLLGDMRANRFWSAFLVFLDRNAAYGNLACWTVRKPTLAPRQSVKGMFLYFRLEGKNMQPYWYFYLVDNRGRNLVEVKSSVDDFDSVYQWFKLLFPNIHAVRAEKFQPTRARMEIVELSQKVEQQHQLFCVEAARRYALLRHGREQGQ